MRDEKCAEDVRAPADESPGFCKAQVMYAGRTAVSRWMHVWSVGVYGVVLCAAVRFGVAACGAVRPVLQSRSSVNPPNPKRCRFAVTPLTKSPARTFSRRPVKCGCCLLSLDLAAKTCKSETTSTRAPLLRWGSLPLFSRAAFRCTTEEPPCLSAQPRRLCRRPSQFCTALERF